MRRFANRDCLGFGATKGDVHEYQQTIAPRRAGYLMIRRRDFTLKGLFKPSGQGSEWNADEGSDIDALPLRAELFSIEQMAQHGRELAQAHVLGKGRTKNPLLRRLDDNEQVLLKACTLLAEATASRLRIAPAGEWLLDNLYLIEEQIRTARKHLPNNYCRELPLLVEGNSKGLPRVYDLALEVIAHGDGAVDADILSGFVAAYQSVTPLTLGELWAIPIMLRLALIENLRRVGVRIMTAHRHLDLARTWADQMKDIAERDPKSLVLLIADMARSNPPITSPFVAELVRCLQGHGSALALPLTWIEQRLAESNLTIDRLVRAENQQRASNQVSISNTISCLRYLGAQDWRIFVEAHSVVEGVLIEDPAECYRDMDFATRDRYRQVIDRLAKRSDVSEAEIARVAIDMATERASQPDADPVTTHVGFFLIDRGVALLEKAINIKRTGLHGIPVWLARAALPLYLGSIALMTFLFTAGLITLATYEQAGTGLLVLTGAFALLAFSHLATALTNWVATTWVTPQRLPRMDFSAGLPGNVKTLVVVPSMLTSAEGIAAQLESLEVCFLGNRDPRLLFGLLTDLRDASTEHCDEDSTLLAQATAGIEMLNARYPGSKGNLFFLLHRPRLWNSAERCWMGRERKRGKLEDLNAALRGSGWHEFSHISGDVTTLEDVQYVITLDSDTYLPRDSARKLVGTMAHPLNRPRLDTTGQRVCAGYGILQPRIASTLSGTMRSRYSQLFGSERGIDPYTRSVSDVYQDLFGEGSFIGKGIYEVDTFEATLKDRFPPNRILSHDLLEGCHARSGLISDVHFYEGYPTTYIADVRRRARWIRGDWQISQWLLPFVPKSTGGFQRNPLVSLARWKIAIILLPPMMVSGVSVLRRPVNVSWYQHLRTALVSAGHSLAQAGFTIACLPHEAWYSLGAIARGLWRMTMSHKGLLEWQISSEFPSTLHEGIWAHYRRMWAGPAVCLISVSGILVLQPAALCAAIPVLLLWAFGPVLAWWVSQPLRATEPQLSEEQLLFLRLTSRKTWSFFEQFVTAENNWLPPDNFQEAPGPVLAHRTSPTNIGLALLANLSACDFGFIPVGQCLERTAHTFNTMASLERYQGHFYNWYNTQSLQPLPPRYVSSVDSGNLAGHLLTLRAGLLDLVNTPVLGPRFWDGLVDTLAMLAAVAPQELQK